MGYDNNNNNNNQQSGSTVNTPISPPQQQQQQYQQQPPQQQEIPIFNEINSFTINPQISNTQQYKFAYEKGHFNFLNGYSKAYPLELINIISPMEYNDIVLDLNKTCQHDPRILIFLIIISVILIIVVPFSIIISLILIPVLLILYFKRMDVEMQKTIEKYNSILAPRNIHLHITKKIERRDVFINYPIDLQYQQSQQHQQPTSLYIPQPYYQQQPQQQQQPQMLLYPQQQQQYNEPIVGDNITLLDKQ